MPLAAGNAGAHPQPYWTGPAVAASVGRPPLLVGQIQCGGSSALVDGHPAYSSTSMPTGSGFGSNIHAHPVLGAEAGVVCQWSRGLSILVHVLTTLIGTVETRVSSIWNYPSTLNEDVEPEPALQSA